MISKTKGIASVIILLIAAIIAIISIKIIKIGEIGINVNKEKQALDSCSTLAGNLIVKTNKIDVYCSNEAVTQCIRDITNTRTTAECHDLGIECTGDVCKRTIKVSSTYNTGVSEETRSTNIIINEADYLLERVNAAVIFLLDYSGSMRGERIQQLKNTVSLFINEDYNLSYSVILYNDSIIETSNIGIGQQHKQTVNMIVARNSSNGGTNFVNPIIAALDKIQDSNYDVYYIVLISDGSPNEGADQSRNIVQNNIFNINENSCINSTPANPCITLYTLGVDNANIEVLKNMSGNAINQNNQNYSYTVDADQTMLAFNAIIEEIVCKIGPVGFEESFYVFNNNNMLEENIDFEYDEQNKVLKFYDADPFYVCTEILQNNNNIIIHWGNPVLNVLD
tara:strand:- start:827 stop:2011 length:1185 start_codon:yes stop_codon:yes gene_type:complete